MLWIHKGYCVVKKLVSNICFKAFWYINKFTCTANKHNDKILILYYIKIIIHVYISYYFRIKLYAYMIFVSISLFIYIFFTDLNFFLPTFGYKSYILTQNKNIVCRLKLILLIRKYISKELFLRSFNIFFLFECFNGLG